MLNRDGPFFIPYICPMKIQKLALDDLELLQYVGRASYAPYYPHIWYPGGVDWYMELCFGTENLRADFADPNLEYWIARDETSNEIIGFLKLGLHKGPPQGGSENGLYLEKIYLMPAFFGKGLGQPLIAFAENRAGQLGRDFIWLMVMKTGPKQVYERAGFRVIGEEGIPFELLREEERGLWVMFKALNPAFQI
jgi:diamine N-acetyltransferase